MKTEHITAFEELLKDDTFKGKDQLKWLLWRNTTEPKFNVGEYYMASGKGQYVYGYPVKDFKAIIKRVFCFKTETAWHYELEAVCICGTNKHTTKIFTAEYNMGQKCEDNINFLGDQRTQYPEYLTI